MVESTAKLREEVLALSGVDIMLDNNTFKSTYQILDELAVKWKDLTDIQQASITELIAGKRQGNIVSSLMTNFDTARDALETSLNSSGSAMKEHEKWQQSLEAQINKLKASWQGLSQAFLKSDFLHGALNGVIGLVDGLTKLIDTLGTLPTLLGVFAGGLSIFKNKGLVTFDKDAKSIQLLGTQLTGLKSNFAKIQTAVNTYNSNLSKSTGLQNAYVNTLSRHNSGLGKYLSSLNGAKASMGGYIASLVKGKAATIGLQVATTVLNTALTMGLSFAIQLVVEGVMKLVNADKELAESVEEITSKFREQHNELKKLQGDYDTTNESSMISKYEKLSKGVDGLGRNISLTAEEYSEYQSIVNSIADQIPSLVSGYDEQGNALLSCKGNVEELTEAYQKLIHAQNQEILTNTKNIEKDFENTLKDVDKGSFLGMGKKVSTPSIELLEKTLNGDYSVDEIKSLLRGLNEGQEDGVYEALYNANIGDMGRVWSTTEVAETLAQQLKTDKSKIKGIIDDYYGQFSDAVEEQKTIAQAVLSEAFDVSGAISGLKYGNINEELQNIAQQTVSSLDYDFFAKLSESGKSVEQWTKEMLNSLNSLNETDNKQIKTGFELQTKFNGGDISYGQYISQLQEAVDFIDKDLKVPDEVKNQIKLSLNSEDILADYNALVHDLKNIGFDDTSINKFLNSLSAEEFSAAMKIIPDFDFGNAKSDVEKELKEYEKGGNVNLTLRPEVDTSVLKDAGWDTVAGEVATVFTSTFSDETGNIAMNFTPIIADEKGNHIGTLSPDELQRYAEEVISGTRKDDLNLQIGAKFEGKDAVQQAETAAQRIHELQESYYNSESLAIEKLQALIDEQLATEFTFDITVQTEGIEAFNTALTESRSAAGLTSESITALKARYEDLDGFNAAALFEKTANGIHLNSEELSRLEEQYINTNKLDIENNLNKLITKYNDLTEEIKSCTDAQEKENLQLQADTYKDKIDELSTLASQYDGLTSAFAKWQTALDGAEEGDNYDSLYENLESIKELYDKGLVGTDKFKTAAQLMTDKDLANADIDEIVDAYKKGYPKMQRYFTEGQKGCKNFLNDIRKLNSEWAHMNKDGSWEINFNAEEVAKELGVSVDFVLQIAKKLKDYGFEVNFEDSSLDNLKTKIEQTEAKLKELGQSPVDINVDIEASSKNLGTIESEIEKAKSKIKEINNSSIEPKVKTAQLEDAQAKLEALIDKKIEASQPAFMNLNTSQVNASLVDALEKIQSYQDTINEVNKLSELKEAGITIDDSQLQKAKEKVDECAKAIQGLDGEVKMAIGLEEDGSVDSIKKAFEEGKVKIDANTDPALTKIEQLAENVEKIEDKDVTINVRVKGLNKVKELNKQIDLATKIDGNIDKLTDYVESAQALSVLKDNINSKVTADVYGNVIKTPEYELNNLKVFSDSAKDIKEVGSPTSYVSANIEGNVVDIPEFAINNLKVFTDSAKDIDDIGYVEANVTAKVNTGNDGDVIDTFEHKLNNLEVFAKGAKALSSVGDVSSTVTAKVNSGKDGDAIDEFEYKLNNLKVFANGAKELKNIGGDVSVEVTAKVNTGNDGDVIDTFDYKLNNLSEFATHAKALQNIKDVDVEVNAKVNTGEDDDVTEVFEYKLNNLGKFAQHVKELQGLNDVNVAVNAKVNTGNDGDVADEFEYKLNNLETFAEGAKALKGIGRVSSIVTAKVNTGDEGDAIDEFEYKLNNLEVFAKGARALKDVGGDVSTVVTAEVNTGDGSAIDEFEYKLDNLGVFATQAKELQGLDKEISVSVNATVNTGDDNDVVEVFEHKLNNLGEFAEHTKELQGLKDVDISVSAKVNTGDNEDVVNTFEYKLNNLGEFAEHTKELQGLEDVDVKVSAKINTGDDGDVVDTFEHKLNNLEVFAKGAKALVGVENVSSTVTAKINTEGNGNVIDKFEGQLNNLEVFAKGAKAVADIGGNPSSTVTAKIDTKIGESDATDLTMFEGRINNLKVFADGAKAIKDIDGDASSTVTAKINTKIGDSDATDLTMFEGRINNLKVFAESAKALKGVGDVSTTITAKISTGEGIDAINRTEAEINKIRAFAESAKALKSVGGDVSTTITAKMSGNAVSGEGVSDRLASLSKFKSITSGMSDKTATVSVTAKVDSENVNKAIQLLKDVSSSGVFKDYKATVQVGAKIATIDDTTVKNYKAPEKEGKVKYSVDPKSSVFTWKAPSKDGVVNYSAEVEALTKAQKNKTGTITYKAKVTGFPVVNGTANVNGSAFANGTSGKAYRQGDWGVKKTTTALTGELGQELVVYGNRFWTVGDHGAEFATIPKGAIVFNHKQTKELFANGKVVSDGGRGRILANGTAYAEGTAFNNITGDGSFYGSSNSKSSSTKNKVTGKTYNKKSSSSDTTEDFEETFNFVETAIERIERDIDNLDQKANRTYKSWSSRNNALTKEISKIGEEISLQQEAYEEYMAAANGVGLSSAWKKKIQKGTLDIKTVKDETLAEKIKDYEKWYKAALDCKDAIEDLKDKEAELYRQRFENVQSQYDNILQGYDHTESMLNEYIAQAEAKGHIVSEKYYTNLIANEKQNINTLKQEQADLIKSRDEAVASGKIAKHSEEW